MMRVIYYWGGGIARGRGAGHALGNESKLPCAPLNFVIETGAMFGVLNFTSN